MSRDSSMRDRTVSATSKKYRSTPMFGARQRDPARHLVRPRRPHEVAAVRVDVHRELDVRERVHDPVLVADLGLGLLERAREHVARAGRVGAVVAVEQRADGVVAVEVDADRVAVGRRPPVTAAGGRAVVDHVAALGLEVVQRVVPAVRVDRGDDEDVEVVDQLLRRRIGRVVTDQPFAGLQARDRRHPLASVLLAVDEDADLRTVAHLADPQHLHLERPALHVRRRVQPVAQRHARARLRDAGAGVSADRERLQLGARRRGGVDRRHDLGRRAGGRAGRVGGEANRQVVARPSSPTAASPGRRDSRAGR